MQAHLLIALVDWQSHVILIALFLVIAFIYASVGFGGGSSYLALLSLFVMPVADMKLTALVCNLVVVSGATWLYWHRGELALKKVLPIVLVSVPLAYIGALWRLSDTVFFVLLGVSLIAAGILLLAEKRLQTKTKHVSSRGVLVCSSTIGLLSGMVGIGGGIFLSPILNLIRWDLPKRIAATASLFILVNSVSGLVGLVSAGNVHPNWKLVFVLAFAVLLGGQLGNRVSNRKFSQLAVKRLTGILVMIAGLEILFKQLILPYLAF